MADGPDIVLILLVAASLCQPVPCGRGYWGSVVIDAKPDANASLI
jgi:hypothetical protein